MLCNYALCKSIAIFHLIEKVVFHMPLKALLITTHTVSMAWRVSISFSVWQNGTQSTIDRCCFLPSLYHAHDKFLLPNNILHIIKWYVSVNKRVCCSWININVNATFIQRWPVWLMLMLIYKQYILNQNITYEPTKSTSLLAF